MTSTTETTLYGRLGGDDAIRAVVGRFVDRILSDPDLAPTFAGMDIDRHARYLAAFVAAATGGPSPWKGRDIATAHRNLDVSGEQFDRVAGHLAGVLTECAVPPDVAGELLHVVGTLRAQIVLARPIAVPAPSAQLRRSPTML